MKPTEKQINEIIDIASDRLNDGVTHFGMSYEDGVKDALLWVIGIIDEAPLSREDEDNQ